jgi:hypothetical protein
MLRQKRLRNTTFYLERKKGPSNFRRCSCGAGESAPLGRSRDKTCSSIAKSLSHKLWLRNSANSDEFSSWRENKFSSARRRRTPFLPSQRDADKKEYKLYNGCSHVPLASDANKDCMCAPKIQESSGVRCYHVHKIDWTSLGIVAQSPAKNRHGGCSVEERCSLMQFRVHNDRAATFNHLFCADNVWGEENGLVEPLDAGSEELFKHVLVFQWVCLIARGLRVDGRERRLDGERLHSWHRRP